MRPMNARTRTALFLIPFTFCLFFPIAGAAAGPERVAINPENPENLTVTAGKSVILESGTPIKRFSIAAPEVADALVLTPHQVYLTGKTPGATSLSLWGRETSSPRSLTWR